MYANTVVLAFFSSHFVSLSLKVQKNYEQQLNPVLHDAKEKRISSLPFLILSATTRAQINCSIVLTDTLILLNHIITLVYCKQIQMLQGILNLCQHIHLTLAFLKSFFPPTLIYLQWFLWRGLGRHGVKEWKVNSKKKKKKVEGSLQQI